MKNRPIYYPSTEVRATEHKNIEEMNLFGTCGFLNFNSEREFQTPLLQL